MSSIGSNIAASAIQSAQAQQVAGRARNVERAKETSRSLKDLLDLHVEALEEVDPAKQIPENGSEEAEAEKRDAVGNAQRHRPQQSAGSPSDDDDNTRPPRVDVTA